MTDSTNSSSLQLVKDRFIKVGTRPQLVEYVRQVLDIRPFIFAQARYKSLSGGRGTLLGRTWLLLEPFLNIGVYFVIFGLLLKTDRGIENFLAFLAIGVTLFGPIQRSMARGASIIKGNRGLIKAFSFPRASVVFSDSLRGLYDFVPDLIALALFIVIVPPHVYPAWQWIFIVPIVALVFVFTTGVTFITARISVSFPDATYIFPVLARFWFYGSGVIFAIDFLPVSEGMRTLLQLNPATNMLTMARVVLIEHQFPPADDWLQLCGWAIGMFTIGFVTFWQGEGKYNRV